MIEPDDRDEARGAPEVGGIWRGVYLALGFAMLGLGIVGAFLPVMPTTIFIIAAAFFFGRSSPRLEAWLLDHPRFGPPLVAWRREGAIPVRAKLLAVAGMAMGYGVFLAVSHPGGFAKVAVAAFMLSGAAYVLSRPNPGSGPPAA